MLWLLIPLVAVVAIVFLMRKLMDGDGDAAAIAPPALVSLRDVRIFISYRRADSEEITDRICEDLVDLKVKGWTIFRDVDGSSIPAGADYEHSILAAVSTCSVFLPIIGKRWLDIKDASGRRRLDDPADLVRIEIERAIESGRPIVPILVQDARMPAESELPDGIRALCRKQAVKFQANQFQQGIEDLIEAIERNIGLVTS